MNWHSFCERTGDSQTQWDEIHFVLWNMDIYYNVALQPKPALARHALIYIYVTAAPEGYIY